MSKNCKNKTPRPEEELCLFQMHYFQFSLTPLRPPAHYQLGDPIPSLQRTCVCACVLYVRVRGCKRANSFEDTSVCMNTNTAQQEEEELFTASGRCLPQYVWRASTTAVTDTCTAPVV